MRTATAAIVILMVLGVTLSAWSAVMPASVRKAIEFKEFARDHPTVFEDDFDPPQPGWTFADKSPYGPMFHADSYNADPDDPCADGLSWWCGEFDCCYASGDGYADVWNQWLLYENVDVSSYPPTGDCLLLTFHGRHDCEVGYDYTYVQAYNPGTGEWDNLNPGYDGSSGGWFDIGLYGFVLDGAPCNAATSYIQADGTVDVRFNFVSDGSWSDADGRYDSDGGAFNVDAVKIFSFYGGKTFMFECDQSVGVPGPASVDAGNYWHLSQRGCITWWSPPNSYVCDNDPDTTSLPGGLNCWLISPEINLSGAWWCTIWYAASMHFDYDTETGASWGGHYSRYYSTDGGACWYHKGTYIGDNERHYGGGACDALRWFIIVCGAHTWPPFGRDFRFAIAVKTDPGGASGCAASNNCWWALEKCFVTGHTWVSTEHTSWGKIKALYK